jgi:HEAT repeat protein
MKLDVELVRALSSQDDSQRGDIRSKLVREGAKSVPKLLVILESEDKRVTRDARRAAIRLLGYIGDTRAVKPLVRFLQGEYLSLEKDAVWALGRIGDPDAIPYLTSMLKSIEKTKRIQREWQSERGAICEALGRIGTERAIQILEERLVDGRRVDRDVALALGATFSRPRALYVLERALADDTLKNPVALMRAISRSGGISAVRVLGGVIVDGDGYLDGNAQALRDSAAEYIALDRACGMDYISWGRQEHVQAISPLIEALGNEHLYTRQKAAQSLGVIGNRLAVHALSQALEDREAEVREAAYEALGKIGGGRAIKALLEAVPTEKACWAQVALAEALGRLGDARGVQALARFVGDSDKEVRQAVAKAFGEIGMESAVPHLARLLADKKQDVAVHAAVSLGNIGGRKAEKALESCKTESPALKDVIEAASWLAKGPYTLKELESALQSSSAPIRKAAVVVLSQRPSPKAIKLLRRAAENTEDRWFASQVRNVLERLTVEDAW